MTRNLTKDHIQEIFSCYGVIKAIEFPLDRYHPPTGRGHAFVEFTNAEDAETAMKHMDGGQIDGQEITVSPVASRNRQMMRRQSPPPFRGRPQSNRWNRSPLRFRRRSPLPRRRSPRRRSRSPVRRRRRSNSSDSSR